MTGKACVKLAEGVALPKRVPLRLGIVCFGCGHRDAMPRCVAPSRTAAPRIRTAGAPSVRFPLKIWVKTAPAEREFSFRAYAKRFVSKADQKAAAGELNKNYLRTDRSQRASATRPGGALDQ